MVRQIVATSRTMTMVTVGNHTVAVIIAIVVARRKRLAPNWVEFLAQSFKVLWHDDADMRMVLVVVVVVVVVVAVVVVVGK